MPVWKSLTALHQEIDEEVSGSIVATRIRGETRKTKLDKLFQIMPVLETEGFTAWENEWNLDQGCVTLRIDRKDLTKVYKVVGRLELGSKSIVDTRKRLIDICLKSVEWPGLEVVYTQKLSRNDKCKIVRSRPSSYASIVCGR